jgi:hypothetical protein
MYNPQAIPRKSGARRWAVSFCVAIAITSLHAAGRNIAPDALTRATTWNSHTGDLSLLADGRFPPQQAQPFVWQTKGILVFEWDEPQTIERVRLYVGQVGNNYQVRAYLGGRLDPTGTLRDPEGVQTALVEENSRLLDQWVEVLLPPGTRADNLELWNLGSTEFYEVEILVQADASTAVDRQSWGRLKALVPPR